jgi:hypothetical protein
MTRPYYPQRTGGIQNSASLSLVNLKRAFGILFGRFESKGYFQEYLGYYCTGDGEKFIAGLIGIDPETEIIITVKKPNLWPVASTINDWSEGDFFGMIEFLYDHVSKATAGFHHSNCGWHGTKFDRTLGQTEYREELNRLLRNYDSGFELLENGQVLALAPTGLESLVEAPLHHSDTENVTARVDAAIQKFRLHRSSVDTRKDAVRDLADVLEYLRPKIKELVSQDEADLFNIANNFGIRHHKAKQKVNYDKDIWFDWIFYYYLATIHAVVRLIKKQANDAT